MRTMFLGVAAAALMAGGAAWAAPASKAPVDPARAAHEAMLTLDTHLDTPANFSQPGWSIMDRHSAEETGSQVDYPRMVEGGLDGGFFVVYTAAQEQTPEGDRKARDMALVRAVEIHEMVARHGEAFALALKADDAARIAGEGKRFVFISMENSQPVESDLSLMKTFYDLGVRMMGPVHFKTNDLADSATDAPRWQGLSSEGKAFVAEANRLGVILDASHASDDVLDQMIALSKTPVVLSHSGAKAVYNHPRNIDDARMKALAASGGVIQVLAFTNYMVDVPKIPAREAAMAAMMKEFAGSGPPTVAKRKALMAKRREIEEKWPTPKATIETFMAHLLHALKVAGVDHVGIGLDLDGGGGVVGLNDVSTNWKITELLLKQGYSPADIEKIWSGNLLRVMRAVEAAKGG